MAKSIYVVILFLVTTLAAHAQHDGDRAARLLQGTVTASDAAQEVAGATIRVYRQKKLLGGTVSDAAGHFIMRGLPPGALQLRVTAVGYQPVDTILQLQETGSVHIYMQAQKQAMNEVVVTAAEKKGMTSTTIIGQTAMEHLQPSSFA
ncbi:carboxypeptidase-like regulatory domain-containing protein, partial [Prevotella denticola]